MAAILEAPHILFVDTPDYSLRHLAVAPLADPSARQVLDDGHVLNSIPAQRSSGTLNVDIWVAPINGSGEPRIYLADALSPSVVR